MSKLTGQTIPVELGILLLIKAIQPYHKYYARADGFSAKSLEKSIFFVKMTSPAMVWPASSDFCKSPKFFQSRLLTSKIISLPCTDNVVYLFNLLSTNFYSATLLKNSFIWLFSECFSELYAQQNLFATLLAVKIKSRMNV